MSFDTTIPADLWARAAEAPSRLLMLDYDGTLAPLVIDRAKAVPSPRTLELVSLISASPRTRVAVISGRPVRVLEAVFGGVNVRMVGEHGWESRAPDGRLILYPVPSGSRAALDGAAEVVLREPWADRLEVKRASLMLHTRGLPRDSSREVEFRCARMWERFRVEGALRLRCVDGGIELRAPGRHKGTAAMELIADSPTGALPVYVGDDDTDEDAFERVRHGGFGIMVASEARPTRATGRLASVDEVTAFLERWLTLEGAADGGPPDRTRGGEA